MGQTEGPREDSDPAITKRRVWQALLARGFVTHEEYNLVGRHYGFVSIGRGKRAGAFLRSAGPAAGWALLGLAAALEIAARARPELRGPIDGIQELLRALGGAS